MVKYIWLFAFTLLLVGCNEDKLFLTHNSDVAVIDITLKDIFFNGEKIGETINDIELEKNALTIKPLEIKLEKINPKPTKVHIHIAGLNSFNVLTHAFMSILIRGSYEIEIALDDDFKNTVSPYMFRNQRDNNHPCRGAKGVLRQLLNEKAEAGMTAEEKYQKRLKELEKDRECAKNYMELNLSYFNDKDSVFFDISLNELGVVGTNKYTRFGNENELWRYIEEIRSRESLQNKIDKDEILFVAKGNTKVKDIAPYLIHLSQMGYSIKFATMY